MRVTIIDLDIQNILSVENAFRVVGAEVEVARDALAVEAAEFLVLPGVGAFGAAMARLHASGIGDAVIAHAMQRRRPLLGLCLGMQLLADGSQEFGFNPGLGIIPGTVELLREAPPEHRVPNIGWRNVVATGSSALLPASAQVRSFYHVHSYHLLCAQNRDVAATTRFGAADITSIVHRDNVFATQFHPEKSQDAGLDLLHHVLHKLH